MQLLLWRHAEAEDGDDDMQRALTPRGRKQAKSMGAWLLKHGPKDPCILVSPAVRAQQTAEALTDDYEKVPDIAPAAQARALLAAIEARIADKNDESVIVVGHQPALGELAALLISKAEAPWAIKKGALWWLTRRSRSDDFVLRAVLSPEFLR